MHAEPVPEVFAHLVPRIVDTLNVDLVAPTHQPPSNLSFAPSWLIIRILGDKGGIDQWCSGKSCIGGSSSCSGSECHHTGGEDRRWFHGGQDDVSREGKNTCSRQRCVEIRENQINDDEERGHLNMRNHSISVCLLMAYWASTGYGETPLAFRSERCRVHAGCIISIRSSTGSKEGHASRPNICLGRGEDGGQISVQSSISTMAH